MKLSISTSRAWRARIALSLAIAAGLGVWLSYGLAVASADARAATTQTPGTFELTDAQVKTIGIEPVASVAFHSEISTDGKIAFDGDHLTPVYSPYSGRVTRVIAPLGATVRAGQSLFQLDASEYAQAESDLLTAQAQLRLATDNEQRRHTSYDAHGASLQDWQQAQNDLAAAQAGVASVRNRLRILGQSDGQIDALLAGKNPPQAGVSAVAPIAGLVVDRQIGPGQYVQAGASSPVYTIANLSTVWLVANVRDADAEALRIGQTVQVQVPSLPGRTFNAKLTYIAATVDPTIRRVAVHALIDNKAGLLRPEMFADATIQTSEDSNAPAVPQQAVIYEGEQARVWVMRSDRSVALRPVRLGRERDGRLEVLSGLNVGERVVTRGALFIDRAANGE